MATDATGTPTTNYAIPTYNTAVDAPSGDGFNAAITVVDSSLKTVSDIATSKPSFGVLIAMA